MKAHELKLLFSNMRATAYEGRYDLMSAETKQLVTVRWGEGDDRRFSILLQAGTISPKPADWGLGEILAAVSEWQSLIWASSEGPKVNAFLAWLKEGDEQLDDGTYVMPNEDLMSYALDHHRFRHVSEQAARLSRDAAKLRSSLVGLQGFLNDDVVLVDNVVR